MVVPQPVLRYEITHRQCFAGPSLCNADDITSTQCNWPALRLDGRRLRPVLLMQHSLYVLCVTA